MYALTGLMFLGDHALVFPPPGFKQILQIHLREVETPGIVLAFSLGRVFGSNLRIGADPAIKHGCNMRSDCYWVMNRQLVFHFRRD